MDYIDIPRLNDVPVAAVTTISEKNVVRFVCSNLVKYIFKFNKSKKFEYCVYRDADMQEITDTKEIPDFDKALEMATSEIHGIVFARGSE